MQYEVSVGQTQCHKCIFLLTLDEVQSYQLSHTQHVLAFLTSAVKWFLVATENEIEP